MNRSQCDAIRPLISAALDGELDEDEFVRLSEHLAGCPSCRQVHQDYHQLRDGMRTVPNPAPPPEVSRTILQETVEKPPPSKVVRFVARAGLRVGMSTVAASIVILIVVSMIGYYGYDERTSPPVVAASQPTQESDQRWPVTDPVVIEFNKPMNHDSVMQNLIIRPNSDQDPLPTSWDGNRLIIGRSDTHTAMLKPNTDYMITILPNAEDRYGNPIGDFWVLRFQTGPPHVAVATPPAERESSSDDQDIHNGSSDNSPFFSQEPSTPDDSENSGSNDVAGTDDEPSVEASTDRPSGSSESDTDDSGQQQARGEPTPTEPATPEPTEAPTEVPTEPVATSTPVPDPTSTPRPDPTATATATPAPAPTQPPTSDPIPVRGAFGDVYWGNSEIEADLGRPVQEAFSFIGSEQEFQRGLMLRRHDRDRGAIFVLVNGGTLRTFDNAFNSSEHDFPGETLGDGLHVPGGAFGKVWAENGLVELIGHSVSSEPVHPVDAAIQQFDRGYMIYSRGMVYVVSADNNWNVFPDRSGGYQGDDSDSESESEEVQNQDASPENDESGGSDDDQPSEQVESGSDQEDDTVDQVPGATSTP